MWGEVPMKTMVGFSRTTWSLWKMGEVLMCWWTRLSFLGSFLLSVLRTSTLGYTNVGEEGTASNSRLVTRSGITCRILKEILMKVSIWIKIHVLADRSGDWRLLCRGRCWVGWLYMSSQVVLSLVFFFTEVTFVSYTWLLLMCLSRFVLLVKELWQVEHRNHILK